MMSNPWIILFDHLDNSPVRIGPVKSPMNLPVEFQLLDDDGNLYYSGRMAIEQFNPLDNYGEDAGCTQLRYRKAGTNDPWRTL